MSAHDPSKMTEEEEREFYNSLKNKWVGRDAIAQLLRSMNNRYITKVDATTELNKKVTKVDGKDLSEQNYTAFEKNKLNGIQSGAQVNVLEKVTVNGQEQANSDRTINIVVPTDNNQIANSANYQNEEQVAAAVKVETDARSQADTAITDELTAHKNNTSNPHSVTSSQIGLGNVANINQSKAVKSITRDGLTFTATCLDGTTFTFDQQDTGTNTPVMTGATETTDGSEGLVPAATKGSADRYLRSDGTWSTVSGGQEYDVATSSSNGLMSAADKAKLDGIESEATRNISTIKPFTLYADSWEEDGATETKYRYYIHDDLITSSTSTQEILPDTGITLAQLNALSKARIIDGGQMKGYIVLFALGTKPTIDIPIRIIFRCDTVNLVQTSE